MASKDVAGAKKFYGAIFGWKAKDIPMGPDEFYSLMRVGGKDVAAIYPMGSDQRKAKRPPFWMPHIASANVAATAKKAKAAGGKIVMGPHKVMDKGRMAIVMDPTGAAFGVWQAATHKGEQIDERPGTVSWHDLSTKNPRKAGTFYQKTFGWKQETRQFDKGKYFVFSLKDQVGGMWPEPMAGIPPAWFTHFQVSDCKKTVAKVKKLKGKVIMGPMPVPGMGHFAIVADPKG